MVQVDIPAGFVEFGRIDLGPLAVVLIRKSDVRALLVTNGSAQFAIFGVDNREVFVRILGSLPDPADYDLVVLRVAPLQLGPETVFLEVLGAPPESDLEPGELYHLKAGRLALMDQEDIRTAATAP
jgi:hypothetical protein